MIVSMNHIMQEGLKMIFLPLRVFISFKYLVYPNLGNDSLRISNETCNWKRENPFQAFKMCPGWSMTKKHYDRMMEINYRQAKYIQMLSVLYIVQGDRGSLSLILANLNTSIHILCTGG